MVTMLIMLTMIMMMVIAVLLLLLLLWSALLMRLCLFDPKTGKLDKSTFWAFLEAGERTRSFCISLSVPVACVVVAEAVAVVVVAAVAAVVAVAVAVEEVKLTLLHRWHLLWNHTWIRILRWHKSWRHHVSKLWRWRHHSWNTIRLRRKLLLRYLLWWLLRMINCS